MKQLFRREAYIYNYSSSILVNLVLSTLQCHRSNSIAPWIVTARHKMVTKQAQIHRSQIVRMSKLIYYSIKH